MTETRTIEIFSAGCPCCAEAIGRIRAAACSCCEIKVLDMADTGVAQRARELGVGSVPAVAINGKLADCCTSRGPDLEILKAAGLGRPLD